MLNIKRIENDINNELDKIIKVFSSYNDFKQLPEYTRKIKLFIDDILKIQINKFLNKEISNSVFDKRYNRIIIDGVILTTSILSQSNDNTLSIKISEGKENESYAVIPNISLNDSAPWVKLDITCHEKISQYNKDIAHIAQTVINTGYTRLEMFVCGCIKKEEEDFIIEIYKLARQRLPIEFHDKIFFFFIGKEHSKYWFDERAMNAVLKQAKKLKKNRYITPSDTLSELVYSSVPSKLTRGYNEVIPQDKAIAFNPLKIETAKHGIGLSQHILFRSHSFVSQPIVGV